VGYTNHIKLFISTMTKQHYQVVSVMVVCDLNSESKSRT